MPCVNREVVENIFRSLRGRFGNAFVDKYRSGDRVPDGLPHAGKDVGLLETMDVWAHELRELTLADIEHGLKTKFKYPPSADEFVQACCQRDYASLPQNTLPALPPAAITELDRQAAKKHMATVTSTMRGMQFPRDNQNRLDWAERIADEVERHVYRGGTHGAQMAAEAFHNSRRPVPAALLPFVPKSSREDA